MSQQNVNNSNDQVTLICTKSITRYQMITSVQEHHPAPSAENIYKSCTNN